MFPNHVFLWTMDKPNNVYLGSGKKEIKKQFYNHSKSFTNEVSANDTILSKIYISFFSKYIYLVWLISKKVIPYSNICKKFLLFLHEKLEKI